MFHSKKRSDVQVAGDILRINGSQTAIMYGANLSYSQTRKYLYSLTTRGFLERVNVGNGRKQYRCTEEGRRLLAMIEDLEELVGNHKRDGSVLRS